MNNCVADPNVAVGHVGAISAKLGSSKSAEFLDERSYQSDLRSPTPSHLGEAKQACAEKRDGRRLGYEFSDHDFAVTGAEVGDQDLVGARIEGAATPPGPTTPTNPPRPPPL